MATSRGIRNNNPGNIDRSPKNNWQGRMPRDQMTPEQRRETRFEVFKSPVWGIRAMCVLLITYYDRHGCNTVRKLINRWAPPVENNTGAYAEQVSDGLCEFVAQQMCLGPDEPINVHEYLTLRPLVTAIIHHENGSQPYNDDVIEEALRLAGVVKPNAPPLVAVPQAVPKAAVTAAAVGTAGAVAEICQQAAPVVQQTLPVVNQVNAVATATTGLPGWLRMTIAVGIVIAAGFSVFTWWRLRRARKAVTP